MQTTLFSGSDAEVTTRRPVGIIASSVVTFVNDQTTSEYVTLIKGTTIDGSYAHITTKSSRVFYAEPIRLITATVFNAGKLTAAIESTLDGSLQPDPVLGKEILVTATKDYFTRQGPDNTFVTHTILKGSIPVNEATGFKFLLSDSMSSDQSGIMLVKEGDGTRVIYSSEANFEVVQPPRSDGSTPVIRLGTAKLGEDKLSGVLVEFPKNEMNKPVQNTDINTDDIELLTITIGTPVDVAHATKYPENFPVKMNDLMQHNTENEITENTIPHARKVSSDNVQKEVIVPDRVGARNLNLPTFTVKVPDQTLEEVIHGAGGIIKKPTNKIPEYTLVKKSKDVEDIRAEFNLESGDRKSDLPTVTYVGFADFTTTIADTVVVFTPKSKSPSEALESYLITATETSEPDRFTSPFDGFGPISSLAPRIAPSGPTYVQTPSLDSTFLGHESKVKDDMKTVMVAKADGSSMMQDEKETIAHVTDTSYIPGITFSTVDTTRYNTVDLYPSGLVSSIGGTIIGNGMTTVFTTYIYGTFIKNQYAQIVQSTSSIFYLVSRTPTVSSIKPTKQFKITASQQKNIVETVTNHDAFKTDFNRNFDYTTTESINNNILEDYFDNSLGRAISSDPSDQIIVEKGKDGKLSSTSDNLATSSSTVLTYYTTYVRNGELVVSTQYKTSTVLPFFDLEPTQTLQYTETSHHSKDSVFTTLTYHTTKLVSGSTELSSHTKVPVLENTKLTDDNTRNFHIMDDESFTTPTTSTESVTESYSESISETSTDLSSNDVTEHPILNLDSSLNLEDDIDAIFYPRTYYITYTYFTTYHQDDSSSVLSSFETITNIISNSLQLDEHKTISPVIATPPVTYWTTYTYWTTFFRHNTTITTSSEETVSNIVGVSVGASTKTPETLVITPTSSFTKPVDFDTMETVDATTYYTTYTYYTSTFLGTSTIVNSRLDTITNVIHSTPTASIDTVLTAINFGFDDTTEQSTTDLANATEENSHTEEDSFGNTVNDQPIGLLSTIRASSVIDGTTTIFSTRVFGTMVDGLYFQMQSTTSEIIAPSTFHPIGVLTVNSGEIIEQGLTTHFTSQHIGIVAEGITITEVRSTSTINGEPDFSAILNKESQTGIIQKTVGSIIHGTVTTVYESTVIGTHIDGLYAQIIESSSSTVIGTTATFTTLPAKNTASSLNIRVTPTLMASLNDITISPTPVSTPSIRIPIAEKFASAQKDKKLQATNAVNQLSSKASIRSSVPGGRPSSLRRPDIFGFIRRTSTFTFPSTLIGNLPDVEKSNDVVSSTTEPDITSTKILEKNEEPEKAESLMQPTRRLRFHSARADRPSVNIRPSAIRGKISISSSSVKPIENTKVVEIVDDEEAEKPIGNSPVNSFRPFSFRRQEVSAGSRSSLPFLPRGRKTGDDSENSDSNRITNSKFAPTTVPTTSKPESTSKKTNEKVNNRRQTTPVSVSKLTAEERRKQRQRLASRPALSRLFPNKNPDSLTGDASELAVVYADVDGSLVTPNDPIEMIFFTPEEAYSEEGLHHNRKKRQVGFGSRVTSRGIARNNQSPIVEAENIQLESRVALRTPREPQTETNSSPRVRSRNTSPIRIPSRNAKQEINEPLLPIDEAPSQPERETPVQFTLTNARSRSRAPTPSRPRPGVNNDEDVPAQRSLNRLRNPSRNSVPLGNIRGRGFRRPATDNNIRTTSRFSRPDTQNNNKRPNPTPARNRNARPNNRKIENNPIADFRNRPTPEIEPEPFLLPSSDGSFDLFEPITVTRAIPVTTSIPFVNNGKTSHKEIITASTHTEVIQPDDIIQTEINGEVKLLLSTIQNGNQITRVLVEPVVTVIDITANAFTNGKRAQVTQALPTQIFNVVTMTATEGGDVQSLLQLLLGQQQNPLLAALGLGGPTSSLQVRTSTYVTTVTSVLSTLLPIIFRGKMVTTTVVDSRTEVITATELITETVFAQNSINPFITPNPLNQLLPLLLQNQLQQQQQQAPNRITRDEHVINVKPNTVASELTTVDPAPVVQTSVVTMFVSGRRPGQFSTILSTVTLDGGASRFKRHPTTIVKPTALAPFINTNRGLYQLPEDYNYEDIDWYILSAINEVDNPHLNDITPSLDSVANVFGYDLVQSHVFDNSSVDTNNPFLWTGPAGQITPKRRTIRSAQRGSRRFGGRFVEGRKIQDNTGEQPVVLDDSSVTSIHTHPNVGNIRIPGQKLQNQRISDQIQQIYAPTTYYTTFTYYTTLVDDAGREFVQSSLDTITQVATQGGGNVNDLTRLATGVHVQPSTTETFSLGDAIIPGKPRLVSDPSFTDPEPPFGPIVKGTELKKKTFQNTAEFPSPLSVQPVNDQSSNGRPLLALPVLSNQSPLDSIHSDLETPGRKKVIKTLRRRVNPEADIKTLEIPITNQRGSVRQRISVASDQSLDEISQLVVTQLQEQVKAPTAVAVPVDPYIGTVATLYTVYSYLYEISNGDGVVISSTRDVTVSNKVRPTIVTIPGEYRVAGNALNTLEVGGVTATLGERIRDTVTTQIYLASATLVDLNAGFARARVGDNEKLNNVAVNSLLQSSLLDNEEVEATETPSISPTDRFQQTNDRHSLPHLKVEPKLALDNESETEVEITTEHDEVLSGRPGGHSQTRGSVRFQDSPKKVRFTVTRRRPQPPQVRTAVPNRSRSAASVVTARTPTPLRSFMRGRQRSRGNSTVESAPEPSTTTKPLPKIPRGRGRERASSTSTSTTTEFLDLIDDYIYDDTLPIDTSLPNEQSQSSTLPSTTENIIATRPPRPSVRRDDIPIIRRPAEDKERKLQLTTPNKTSVTQLPDAESSTKKSPVNFSSLFGRPPIDLEFVDATTSPLVQSIRKPHDDDFTESTAITDETTIKSSTTLQPAREFRFIHKGSEEGKKPTARDPLLFKSGPERLPPRESRLRIGEQEISTTESSTAGIPAFKSKLTSTNTSEHKKNLSNLDSDLLPAEYLDDYYDYYYDDYNLGGKGGKADNKSNTENKTEPKTKEPTPALLPNVVYKTFTTNTFLPILDGEQTLTLSIVTSTLETLHATDAHLITKAPALFNPELLPKAIRDKSAPKSTRPFGFFSSTPVIDKMETSTTGTS